MVQRIERTVVRVRSRWHRFWMFCLIAYSLFMAVDLWLVSSRLAQLRRTAKGLEQLAISMVGQGRLSEIGYTWAAGAAIFAILAWLTRGKTVTQERIIDEPESPQTALDRAARMRQR